MPNFEPEFYPETDDHKVVIPQGFASPAEDDLDVPLNLHTYVVRHRAATFFVRMTGRAMELHGIFDGDILVIDRSLTPKKDSIVVALIDGEFIVRVYGDITKEGEVWGVVTFSVKHHKT
jgi:DNA polymerase V